MTGKCTYFSIGHVLCENVMHGHWYCRSLNNYIYIFHSLKSERLRLVDAVVDSTPVLRDTDTIKSFLASQQHNSGVIGMLFDFVKLMALHYDHKWYVILGSNVTSLYHIHFLLGPVLHFPMSSHS